MDFAPYQSSPPETTRALSPQTSPRHSADFVRRSFSPTQANIGSRPSPPPLQHPQPQRHWGGSSLAHEYRNPSAGGDYDGDLEAGRGGGLLGGLSGGGMVSEFDTSLGIRLDYEAAAAYLALPPLGPIVLLILERKSDYVR